MVTRPTRVGIRLTKGELYVVLQRFAARIATLTNCGALRTDFVLTATREQL